MEGIITLGQALESGGIPSHQHTRAIPDQSGDGFSSFHIRRYNTGIPMQGRFLLGVHLDNRALGDSRRPLPVGGMLFAFHGKILQLSSTEQEKLV